MLGSRVIKLWLLQHAVVVGRAGIWPTVNGWKGFTCRFLVKMDGNYSS